MLVVDDNAENRALAQATLEDEGYRVVLARGGAEAVELAAAERPDCVLMDIRMPHVDGIVACERIRSMPGGGDIAIVFATAQRDVATFDRAEAAGGDDFLTKPFRTDELVIRVQAALRARRLAAECSELYEQVKHQRDALQRLQLQKEQLASFLVHDLKNPVGAIELQAQRILRDPAASDRGRGAGHAILDESRALMRMLLNLLDLSKADEGGLQPAPRALDPGPLVAGVIDELRARATDSGVELRAEVHASRLTADPDLLHRVLANLVENAIRHAPEGSTVSVSVAETEDSSELRVRDEGHGIPADQRTQVFERYATGGGGGRNRGLGLAFCKRAVEAHGGQVCIEDGAPGAVFCVRLPHAVE